VPIGPVAGLVEGPEGGVVFVAGMATFAFDADDEVGRRLAAVQLVAMKIASAVAVAEAFGTTQVTLWRWRRRGQTGNISSIAVCTSPSVVSTARHCPSVNLLASPAAVVEANPDTGTRR